MPSVSFAAVLNVAAPTTVALAFAVAFTGAHTYANAGENRKPAGRAELAQQLVRERAQAAELARENRALRRTIAHQPTVQEAIGLASVVYNVPRGTLLAVAACESGLRPAAENPTSTASGLFQFLYWHRTRLGAAGFSGHSPYAQAFQAAEWVRERGLAPWYASRHCWGGAR